MALALLLPNLATPGRAMEMLDRYLPWKCAGGPAFYVTLPLLLSKHFPYFHWHLPQGHWSKAREEDQHTNCPPALSRAFHQWIYRWLGYLRKTDRFLSAQGLCFTVAKSQSKTQKTKKLQFCEGWADTYHTHWEKEENGNSTSSSLQISEVPPIWSSCIV